MIIHHNSNAFIGEEPWFALVLSQECIEGIIMLPRALKVSCSKVVLGSLIAENSLTRSTVRQPSCPAPFGTKRRRVWGHVWSTTCFRSRCQALHGCDGWAGTAARGHRDVPAGSGGGAHQSIAERCCSLSWWTSTGGAAGEEKGQAGLLGCWDQGRFWCALLGGVAISRVELIWFLTASNSSCLGLRRSRGTTSWACAGAGAPHGAGPFADPPAPGTGDSAVPAPPLPRSPSPCARRVRPQASSRWPNPFLQTPSSQNS